MRDSALPRWICAQTSSSPDMVFSKKRPTAQNAVGVYPQRALAVATAIPFSLNKLSGG